MAHALLIALAFPPFDLWLLTFLIPVPLALLALRAASTWRMLAAVLIAQVLLWLWLLRWIIAVTAVGYPFLALYMSLHVLLLAWVLRRALRSERLARVPRVVLLPAIWTAAEYFRGEIAFDGYPWYLLAHPLIEWLSFTQSADLLGVHFVSFLAAMPAGAALDAFTRAAPARSTPPGRARFGAFVGSGVAALVVLVANVAYGQWRLHQRAPLAPGPRVLAIQTNLPQSNKIAWSPEQQAIDIPRFMDLTRRAIEAVGGPEAVDLVVWPETMVPSKGFDPATLEHIRVFVDWDYLTRWVDAVEALRRELGVPMLVGSEAWIGTSIVLESANMARLERAREYNSAFLLQGDAAGVQYDRYDKAVLTPFGETMPYISSWPWLEQQLLALGAQGMQFNLDANSQIALLALRTGDQRTFKLATPICFEDTVARLCRRMAHADGGKRADVFVNLSNDGWFGESDADRRLHAQIARFRCIENRVPMVRCVNTGLSVHIDSAGRVQAAAGANDSTTAADGADKPPYGVSREPGWVLANVHTDSRRTLYGRIGGVWPSACGLAALVGLISTFRQPRAAGVNT